MAIREPTIIPVDPNRNKIMAKMIDLNGIFLGGCLNWASVNSS